LHRFFSLQKLYLWAGLARKAGLWLERGNS